MLEFEEARRKILADAVRLGSERVSLWNARGRHLAADLVASIDLPGFDYSAMDGYAFAAADFSGAAPWQFQVAGESKTGNVPGPLARGTAMRIFTGAPLPADADLVVMQEDISRDGLQVTLVERPVAGQNVRKAGDDLRAGSVALPVGTRLDAAQLGLVASLDVAEVDVAQRPRVTIVCTGDELRPPGSTPLPGTIPESNSIAIATLAERAGAVVRVAPLARDEQGASTEAFRAALGECDLLVTIGGVSVGDYDLVKPALEAAGASIDFWKVRIKPGKPLVWGRAGATRILGLPGNPVSAQVTFGLFGMPLLRAMQGNPKPLPATFQCQLLNDLQHHPGRESFYRGRLAPGGVHALPGQSSGAATSTAWADVLIQVSAESGPLARGASVSVLALAQL